MKKQIIGLILSACMAGALFFGFAPAQSAPPAAELPDEPAAEAFAPQREARAPQKCDASGVILDDPCAEPEESDKTQETAEAETTGSIPAETDEPTVPTEVTTEAPESETTAPEQGPDFPLPVFPASAIPAALYINGCAAADGLCAVVAGTPYIALEAFEDLLALSAPVCAEEGQVWIECGERCIPCSLTGLDTVVLSCGGTICVPVSAAASAAGIQVSFTEGGAGAVVSFFGVPGGASWENYYPEEDLYWLSRIINAEARGECFLGQLAVGSVVMNRVRSRSFPDTVKGVIFDNKFGVQFSPAYSGSINREPNLSCIIAAKLTLEGFSVSDSILFFFANSSPGGWITRNRTYTMTVGGHDFYS